MLPNGIIPSLLALIFVASTTWPVVSYVNHKEESAPDRVKVSLYDETLCPACREFVKSQLGPTWNKLKGIMQVELNAYGWAEESPMGSGYNFTCQHGPDECTGNMILECAKSYTVNIDSVVNFAVCFMSEKKPLPPPQIVGRKCARSSNIDWPSIKKCITSVEGQKLLHEAGVKFHSLQDPEPSWVPWILINDKANDDAELNLLKVVCSTYKGTPPIPCLP